MYLVSAGTLNSRFTQLVIAAACVVTVIWLVAPTAYFRTPVGARRPALEVAPRPPLGQKYEEPLFPLRPQRDHPIDHLIAEADQQLNDLLNQETWNVHDAARAYRDRRGRQPPPGFDVWHDFARNNSVIIVEEFWDRIYHDLNPFWGVPAKQIREQAHDFKFKISVRDRNVTLRDDGQDRPWMQLWSNLTSTIAEYLPDLDMPINIMDESREIVAWEEIDGYMKLERASRNIVPVDLLKDQYQSLKFLDENPPEKFYPEWSGDGPYWQMAVIGCPPESAARQAYIETDFSLPPTLQTTYPQGSYEGYVKNWTLAKSPCDNAHLQGLHGTFVEPLSISNSKKFFPLFGGSKLEMNNEILLPAAMYWTFDPFYSGGEDHGEAWKAKYDAVMWRGAASGGRNHKNNWTRFQRHRFVAMVNGTSVRNMELGSALAPPNFALPANGSYDLAVQSAEAEPGAFGDWVESWGDAAVVHLLCYPLEPYVPRPKKPPYMKHSCSYTDPYFSVAKEIPMSEQYDYKYLPDVDGNSFSGRYRGFLGSTSLPIKATIYQEWHDSRLVPWKHFVPMDNTFVDFYGIMEYFLGNRKYGIQGHDEEAKKIAIGGKQWAEKVLRREDMQIYVLRLLLEYARLCDDGRETMGWKESAYNASTYGSSDGVT